ncbi:atherin [Panicum miliaceum]|uniref:Atherin n=1 Tax=Panicum miliaceum TaxID=4540 RepID=A0A3L6TL07_PANMI|nr:atherin [Panicum miliaceum]
MLLLRGARAASTVVAQGASGAGRGISIRLTAVAALSSGGRRRKGQRRGEAKAPSPPPPPPQPLPRHGETPSSKKKSGARPAVEAKKNRPAELEQARGPRSPERGGARKGGTPQQQQQQEKAKAKRAVRWKCASGCGACCKLDKGPDFPTPDEIFADHPDDLQLYRSMTGDDGWCINYDKATRTCNIYQDRPSFCRVEPKVFDEFFSVPRNRFDREACSACLDNIKMVYGDDSAELGNFKRVIRDESKKMELEASKNQDKLLDT